MQQLFQDLLVAGQLQEGDFKLAKEKGITVIINNRPDDEQVGQLSSTEAKALCDKLDIEYHYLPMENGKPLPDGLVEQVSSIIDDATGTVLAHCRSGMRSTILWALGKVGQGELTADEAFACANNAGINLSNVKPMLDSIQLANS